MTKIRVGLAGLAGAGKTSLAKHWEAKYGFHTLSFAAAVKQVVQDLALDPNRAHWQAIGDGLRQLIGPDVWINVVDHRLPAWKGVRVVVDDVRYPNEITFLRSRGFQLLCLSRPEADRLRDRPELSDVNIREHPSERLLEKVPSSAFDELIYVPNLKELFFAADAWLEALLKSDPRLNEEPLDSDESIMQQTNKAWSFKIARKLIDKQMHVIDDPNSDVLAVQKASRIIIQALKAITGVGLAEAQMKTILTMMKENEERAEKE